MYYLFMATGDLTARGFEGRNGKAVHRRLCVADYEFTGTDERREFHMGKRYAGRERSDEAVIKNLMAPMSTAHVTHGFP